MTATTPPSTAGEDHRDRVVVVGLGPAGPDLVPADTLSLLRATDRGFVRTRRHPALDDGPLAELDRQGRLRSFDELYEGAASFDDVYAGIVEALVEAARGSGGAGPVVYAVPGSPLVAERSVALLRDDPRVASEVRPALSFLDLAWARLGVDPVASGVRVVDGTRFAVEAAGDRGPLLVAQCHSRSVLSEVKLAVEVPPRGQQVVVLHHLGLPDEHVVDVDWEELDRRLEPDHLTSLWIPELAEPVASELVSLDELVRTLRRGCPWDRRQTHRSLARHLLEEAYEALDAIDALSAAEPDPPGETVAHLEEELGDVLFQVVFHALLAEEAGRFTWADVARTVHDKLVGRHPHVFGDAVVVGADEVSSNWEVIKKAEKQRASVFDGVPATLPALALAVKFQRKAEALPVGDGGAVSSWGELASALEALAPGGGGRGPGADAVVPGDDAAVPGDDGAAIGSLLFAVADLARHLGVDPELALRATALRFREQVSANE